MRCETADERNPRAAEMHLSGTAKSANFAYTQREDERIDGLICVDVAIKSGVSHLQQLNHARSPLLFWPLEQNAPPKTNIEFESWRRFFYCRSAKAPEQGTFITFVLGRRLNSILSAHTANLP